jgi:hypothetical protein
MHLRRARVNVKQYPRGAGLPFNQSSDRFLVTNTLKYPRRVRIAETFTACFHLIGIASEYKWILAALPVQCTQKTQ